jgi:hypothetical protein
MAPNVTKPEDDTPESAVKENPRSAALDAKQKAGEDVKDEDEEDEEDEDFVSRIVTGFHISIY